MTNESSGTSEVFVIYDLLLNQQREVRVYTEEFLLSPHHGGESRGFLDHIAYLGVVERFVKQKIFVPNSEDKTKKMELMAPAIKFNPLYEISVANGRLVDARVKEWKHRNCFIPTKSPPSLFRTMYTGTPEAVAYALRDDKDSPFSKDKMRELADAVEGLYPPYNESLRALLENRNGAMVESA